MKFHFALLFVLCALALARDEGIKALKATATSTNASLFDTVLLTNARSSLFGNCIATANTRKMQYSYISDPVQGKTFVQYEVSRFAEGLSPIKWEREIQSKDIIDCSRASKDYIMFQYNGQTCRMVNKTYADIHGEFCFDWEDYPKDIVYVNPKVQPTGCPARTDVVNGDVGPMCLGVIRMDVPVLYLLFAYFSCHYHYRGMPYSINNGGVSFDAIRNIMRSKKYQGEFLLGIEYKDGYKWGDKSPVNESYFAVVPRDPYFQQLVVMSSRHDYLLVPLNGTSKNTVTFRITGLICLGLTFESVQTEF